MSVAPVFRAVGRAEGVSLLLLFFIAMPLKYLYGHPEFVQAIGMAHGVLFMAYVACAFVMKERYQWSRRVFIAALALSSVPAGTFYFERRWLPAEPKE